MSSSLMRVVSGSSKQLFTLQVVRAPAGCLMLAERKLTVLWLAGNMQAHCVQATMCTDLPTRRGRESRRRRDSLQQPTLQPPSCPSRTCPSSHLFTLQDCPHLRGVHTMQRRICLIVKRRQRKGHNVNLMDRRFQRTCSVEKPCIILVRTRRLSVDQDVNLVDRRFGRT